MTSSTADIAEPAGGGFWSVMRHRNYALLWTGQLISQLGDRLHWMAISLWVYQETGSALSVSFAIMALLVGPAVVGLFAGAVVDRSDRRKILVHSDLLRAALVFLIPALMTRSLFLVYLTLFLVSSVTAFFRPAMFSAIPESVPRTKLLHANALFASMDSSMEVVGPAVAGVLIVKFGYQVAIYVDAFSFLLSALLVSCIRLNAVKPRTHDHFGPVAGTAGLVNTIREGFAYVRRDSVQMSLLALLLGGYWVAGLNSLQTPMAKGVLYVSDAQFASLQMVHGVGFVAASLLLGVVGSAVSKGYIIVVSYILWALSVAGVGLSLNYVMLLVSNFWVGVANMLVFVNAATVIMEHTPGHMVGRVVTMRGTVVAGMRAVALLSFGWLADQTTVRFAVTSMAAVSLVGTLIAAWRFPALKMYGASSGSAEDTSTSGFATALVRLKLVLIRYGVDRVDTEFDAAAQRKLNIIVISLILGAWLAMLISRAAAALAVVAAVLVTALAVPGARATCRWLVNLCRPEGGSRRRERRTRAESE